LSLGLAPWVTKNTHDECLRRGEDYSSPTTEMNRHEFDCSALVSRNNFCNLTESDHPSLARHESSDPCDSKSPYRAMFPIIRWHSREPQIKASIHRKACWSVTFTSMTAWNSRLFKRATWGTRSQRKSAADKGSSSGRI